MILIAVEVAIDSTSVETSNFRRDFIVTLTF
jgi:hypothetical protein